jgi:hypothetical protein
MESLNQVISSLVTNSDAILKKRGWLGPINQLIPAIFLCLSKRLNLDFHQAASVISVVWKFK